MAYTNDIYWKLRNRGNLYGTAYRPSGSDGYWPSAGTTVAWALSQPIQDLVEQGKKLGWQNLGTIGDTYHRTRHGDHTPWSLGKKRCVLYAKDTHVPSWFRGEMLKLMRMADYDTTWIDFVNIDNRQYNYAGEYLGYSGDSHLHVSVREGDEYTHVSLFTDAYNLHYGNPLTGGSELSAKDVWTYDAEGGIENRPWRADAETNKTVQASFAIEDTWDLAHEAVESVKALRAEVATLKTGGVDPAALAETVAALVDAKLAKRLAE